MYASLHGDPPGYASLHITVLISVDRATVANGCLEMAPGSCTPGLMGETWRPLDGEQPKGVEFRPCPTEPGDAVFFDSFAPHRSAPNMTASPRRVLYVTYKRLSEGDHRVRYDADKRRSYPPDIEREPGREYRFPV